MMASHTTGVPIRLSAAVRAGYGIALLVAPARLLALGSRRPVPGSAVTVARVLGTRQVLQAIVTLAAPTGRVAGAGAAVDLLHGASVVALAVVSPRWRTAGLTEATIATALAAAGIGRWRAAARRPGDR